VFTPAALRALNDVVTMGEESLERVMSPTLMIQSREDNRISAATAEGIFNRIAAREKRLEWVDGAAHVITVDYGHETVFASTGKWIQGHSTSPGS
jgi:esterase/lipase